MRPGSGSRCAQTPGIASSGRPATSIIPSTPRRFETLKRPSSGLLIAASPQLDSRRNAIPSRRHAEIVRLEPVLQTARRRGPAREAVADSTHRPEREHARDAHALHVVEIEHRVSEARRAETDAVLASAYVSMSPWYSRWSRDRLVNSAAAEPHAVDAALVEADRRHFHRHAGGTRVAEAASAPAAGRPRPGWCSGSATSAPGKPMPSVPITPHLRAGTGRPAPATGCTRSCRWCRSRP